MSLTNKGKMCNVVIKTNQINEIVTTYKCNE
jgi:hypothetical protein